MPDMKELINGAVRLADLASTVLPGAGLAADAGRIAGKIITVIDDLGEHASPEQQPQMQAARKKLMAAVQAKAEATADRLRG